MMFAHERSLLEFRVTECQHNGCLQTRFLVRRCLLPYAKPARQLGAAKNRTSMFDPEPEGLLLNSRV